MLRTIARFILWLPLLFPPVANASTPVVVASIPPLHSLVAGVMEGIAEPILLIKGNASVHAYSLRPSQVRALHRAQAVFRIGSNLERFLDKPLAALSREVRVVNLMEWPGIRLLPGRSGGLWQRPAHQHGEHGYQDPHIWLDPHNAEVMVTAVVAVLSEKDPEHTARYHANGERLRETLRRLDRELDTTLAPVRKVPYLVFHDAYQYFESRYGLHALGAVVATPERTPGARRLRQVRKLIRERAIRCLFREPQFTPAWLDLLREGTPLRIGTLDPLGADLPPGPDLYFTLMRRLAASLTQCLKQAR